MNNIFIRCVVTTGALAITATCGFSQTTAFRSAPQTSLNGNPRAYGGARSPGGPVARDWRRSLVNTVQTANAPVQLPWRKGAAAVQPGPTPATTGRNELSWSTGQWAVMPVRPGPPDSGKWTNAANPPWGSQATSALRDLKKKYAAAAVPNRQYGDSATRASGGKVPMPANVGVRRSPVPMPVVPPDRSRTAPGKPAVPNPGLGVVKPLREPWRYPGGIPWIDERVPVLPRTAAPADGITSTDGVSPQPVPPGVAAQVPRRSRTFAPLPLVGGRSPSRFAILLGDLRCYDVTGALGDDQLRGAIGVCVGYRDGSRRVYGDWLDFGDVHEGWVTGPLLDHVVATINEARPGPYEREIGRRDPLIDYVRIAITLYDRDRHAPSFPIPLLDRSGTGPIDVTARLQEVDFRGAHLRQKTPSLTGMARLRGRDISAFGHALDKLARDAEWDDLIGLREWHFDRDDLHRLVANAIEFGTPTPRHDTLKDHRDRLRGKFKIGFSDPIRRRDVPGYPECVRQFEMRGDDSFYSGEFWFVKVPESILETWWSSPFSPIADALPAPAR